MWELFKIIVVGFGNICDRMLDLIVWAICDLLDFILPRTLSSIITLFFITTRKDKFEKDKNFVFDLTKVFISCLLVLWIYYHGNSFTIFFDVMFILAAIDIKYNIFFKHRK